MPNTALYSKPDDPTARYSQPNDEVESSSASISGDTLIEEQVDDLPAMVRGQYLQSMLQSLQDDEDQETPTDHAVGPLFPWKTYCNSSDVGRDHTPRLPSSVAGSVGSLVERLGSLSATAFSTGTAQTDPIPHALAGTSPRGLMKVKEHSTTADGDESQEVQQATSSSGPLARDGKVAVNNGSLPTRSCIQGDYVLVIKKGRLDDSTVDIQQNRPVRASTKFNDFVGKIYGHFLRVIHQVDQIRGPPSRA